MKRQFGRKENYSIRKIERYSRCSFFDWLHYSETRCLEVPPIPLSSVSLEDFDAGRKLDPWKQLANVSWRCVRKERVKNTGCRVLQAHHRFIRPATSTTMQTVENLSVARSLEVGTRVRLTGGGYEHGRLPRPKSIKHVTFSAVSTEPMLLRLLHPPLDGCARRRQPRPR